MSTVIAEGFSFDFKNALTAFKFDETNKNLPDWFVRRATNIP
jgi:hypothetical protein